MSIPPKSILNRKPTSTGLPTISLREAAEHDMAVELGLQKAQKRGMQHDENDEESDEEKEVIHMIINHLYIFHQSTVEATFLG